MRKKRIRWLAAICSCGLAVSLLTSTMPVGVYANEWNTRERQAYDDGGFARGILPYSGPRWVDGQRSTQYELVLDRPTEFVIYRDTQELQDLTGKLLVVGDTNGKSYAEWVRFAQDRSAVGLLMNEPVRDKYLSNFRSELTEEQKSYPAFLIQPQEYEWLQLHEGKKLQSSRPHEDPINSYASWGVSSDFVMKPDVVAPGTVYAPFARLDVNDPETYPAFGVLEGTSMSTPTVAGAAVLVKQYLQSIAPQLQGAELTRAIHTQLQNTAFAHRTRDMQLTTPRWQGAGELNVSLATANPLLISTPWNSQDTESGVGKINLRDSIRPGGSSADRIAFTLDMRNLSNEALKVTSAEAVVLVDTLSKPHIDEGKLAEEDRELAEQLPANRVGQGSREVARVPLATQTVAPQGISSLTVDIDLAAYAEQMRDIQEVSPNGFFIDGFVLIEYYNTTLEQIVELSVPFVGFYGDWMRVPVLERSIYERTTLTDTPLYGEFSSVLQTGGGDHTAPFYRHFFNHFSGSFDNAEVVLGADWDFDLSNLRSADMDEVWSERLGADVKRVVRQYIPKNPSVRKDKIAVSHKGNGVKNIALTSPAMRNWLAYTLSLLDSEGHVLLSSESNTFEMNEKHYKDHGMKGTSSEGNVVDDNGVKRITHFGALDLSKLPDLEDGLYQVQVQVRPDAFNMHNPVVAADAQKRGFDQYWQTDTYDLIVDSIAPGEVRITSHEDGGTLTLQIQATDAGSGIKAYRLLDAFGKELAKNHEGTFEIQPEWGDITKLRFEISDYAYNFVQGVVGNRLNIGDAGSLEVTTVCDDASFTTQYYARRVSDGKAFYDLSLLPVGIYDVYLLNPDAGFVPDTWHKRVEIQKDTQTGVTFTYTADSSRTYTLNLLTDLIFEEYESRLPGLTGSTYELEFHDEITGLRYQFAPNHKGLSEVHRSIQPGKYTYHMPGLRRWSPGDPQFDETYQNWQLGIQVDDGYAYTSDVPRSDRLPALEHIDTARHQASTLEFYFYVPRPAPEYAAPVVFDTQHVQISAYPQGLSSLTLELDSRRPQNPKQFRVVLPSRLASDDDILNDEHEWVLVDSYAHTAEINSSADEYFHVTYNETRKAYDIRIDIPPVLRSKLEVGDELIVQEMDRAWKAYPDNQVTLAVVESSSSHRAAERFVRSNETRAVPQAEMRAVINERLNERMGYTQAHKRGWKGTGSLIAVIDNGFELTHPSLQQAAANSQNNAIPDSSALEARINQARRNVPAEIAGRLVLQGRYVNEKIPYAYNYYKASSTAEDLIAGGDEAFEHGTHVSGTAAANPEWQGYPADWPRFTGIAPEAQLAVMSIADSDGLKGNSVEYYAQVIYDAVALGADVVTASLGYGAGTTANVSEDFRAAVDFAASRGVPVLFATGNSGHFSWTEPRGGDSLDKLADPALSNFYHRPLAENPDYGTMDAPAVYDGVLAIGASGANLFPAVDNASLNPWIERDGYTTGYYAAYARNRLFLAPDTEEPLNVELPEVAAPLVEGQDVLLLKIPQVGDRIELTSSDGTALTIQKTSEGTWMLGDRVLEIQGEVLRIPLPLDMANADKTLSIRVGVQAQLSDPLQVVVQPRVQNADSDVSDRPVPRGDRSIVDTTAEPQQRALDSQRPLARSGEVSAPWAISGGLGLLCVVLGSWKWGRRMDL